MANPELVQFYEYVQGTSLIDAYFELDFLGKRPQKKQTTPNQVR